jgi:hypothetical protein
MALTAGPMGGGSISRSWFNRTGAVRVSGNIPKRQFVYSPGPLREYSKCNLALGRRIHTQGGWFSTREASCGRANTMASEIPHTRDIASAGGTDHLA